MAKWFGLMTLTQAVAALPALAKDASGAVQSLKKAGDQVSVMADACGRWLRLTGSLVRASNS